MSHTRLIKEVLKKEQDFERINRKHIKLYCDIQSAKFENEVIEEEIFNNEEKDIFIEDGKLCIPCEYVEEIQPIDNKPINKYLKCYDFEKDGISGTVVLEQYYNNAIKLVDDDNVEDCSGTMYRSWLCLSNGNIGFAEKLNMKK